MARACRGRGEVEADGRPLAGAFRSDSTGLLKRVGERGCEGRALPGEQPRKWGEGLCPAVPIAGEH